MAPDNFELEYASYKDAAGSVFYAGSKVYRQINPDFYEKYLTLKQSGVYDILVQQQFLLPFREIGNGNDILLEVTRLPVVTYPYEWGFEQMKKAALFHLDLFELCLRNNAILKDASPFNIQFFNQRLCFIDHLSIEPYHKGTPWYAYRQFCEMFLAPLLLSHYYIGNWNKQLLLQPEGISIEEAASLLPLRAWLNSLAALHILGHAKYIAGKKNKPNKSATVVKAKVLSLVNHLKAGIESLYPAKIKSNWSGYSKQLPYSPEEADLKKRTIQNWTEKEHYKLILDVGANNNSYSQLLSSKTENIVAMDNDAVIVDQIFKSSEGIKGNFIPLHVDITIPSPSLGLNLKERKSLFERISPDLTLALALIHHLFHSRNIPLNHLADMFASFSKQLIIEFVSENDEQFQAVKNINNNHPYNKWIFEEVFSVYFVIKEHQEIKKGKRDLYFMIKRNL